MLCLRGVGDGEVETETDEPEDDAEVTALRSHQPG